MFVTVTRDQFMAAVAEHEIGTRHHHTAFRSVMESFDIDHKLFASAEYEKEVPLQGVPVTIRYRVHPDYLVTTEPGGADSEETTEKRSTTGS